MADIVESMEVSVVPFAVHDGQTCHIYKLKIKLYKPDLFPKYCDITLEDCEDILEVSYVRELEDAIQNHLSLLSKISGIKNFIPAAQSKIPDETDGGDVSDSKAKTPGDNDDEDYDKDGEDAEDLGGDAQRRKQQAVDEIDYEEESEVDQNEEEPSAGNESTSDQERDLGETSDNDMIADINSKDEGSEMDTEPSALENKDGDDVSESKRKETLRKKHPPKQTDRAIYTSAKGVNFEIHFKFVNEPHILLAQVLSVSMFLTS